MTEHIRTQTLPPTQDSAADNGVSCVTLTIIYDNKPSKSITGRSEKNTGEAELAALEEANKHQLLANAKMLLLSTAPKLRTDFFRCLTTRQ